ncbi:hypothetical protein Bhyg_04233 [Pseudolycoriella hygida]|uniref:Uncharacterized protein n=1 Tax=Pseudolycoriella hygida TaxID=35572 RepID=A0A9Q0NEY4_9DIPT|nr:hypothetical protein Bhyg_04233 [Pseudolycoriella hygida]
MLRNPNILERTGPNMQRSRNMQNIAQIQEENRKQYDGKRKEAQLYVVGELVAIERVQQEKGKKVFPKMIGPYEITKGGERQS